MARGICRYNFFVEYFPTSGSQSFVFKAILNDQNDVYLCFADSSTLLHSCPYPYHTLPPSSLLNRYRHPQNLLTYLKSAFFSTTLFCIKMSDTKLNGK